MRPIMVLVPAGEYVAADLLPTPDPLAQAGTVSGRPRVSRPPADREPRHGPTAGRSSARYAGLYEISPGGDERLVQVKSATRDGSYLFTNVPHGRYRVKGE